MVLFHSVAHGLRVMINNVKSNQKITRPGLTWYNYVRISLIFSRAQLKLTCHGIKFHQKLDVGNVY